VRAGRARDVGLAAGASGPRAAAGSREADGEENPSVPRVLNFSRPSRGFSKNFYKESLPAFAFVGARDAVLEFSSAVARTRRDCRSVELRALCNEVPRTPPGPEGSNGTGNASGAADHPRFLALKKSSVISCQSSVQEINSAKRLVLTED
jgi:hypothetical protein